MIFKSKLRKKIETMRSERLYERAEIKRSGKHAHSRYLQLAKEIKLLDEILSI